MTLEIGLSVVVGIGLVAAVAVLDALRTDGALARSLRGVLAALESLGVDDVDSGEDHHRIGATVEPILGASWRAFAATVVQVGEQRRPTRAFGAGLDPEAVRAAHNARGWLSRAVRENVPRLVVRLGLLGGLVVVVLGGFDADLTEVEGLRATIGALVVAMRPVLFPVIAGLVGSIVCRNVALAAHAAALRRLAAVSAWLDARYPPVSTEELLARLLAGQEAQTAVLQTLAARPPQG